MTARRPRAGADSHAVKAVRDGASLGSARRREPSATREPLRVRRANLADLPTIVEMRLALLRENADHPIYGRLRADAEERAYDIFGAQLQSAHEVMFLAERSGAILGILRCVDTPNSPLLHPARYCYVSSVYVRSDARRRGVLKMLLHHAEQWCEEQGLTEMRLHNVPGGSASAAWAAEGFTVVEEVRRREK